MPTTIDLILEQSNAHPSWTKVLHNALAKIPEAYLLKLLESKQWLPGISNLLNAFSLEMTKVKYILLGESPYPRAVSANGYAFWDNAVTEIWSETGLTKATNRATSLRNFIKMLLVADGLLDISDTSQAAIAKVNKTNMRSSLSELFEHMIEQGFLLLNASLVLSENAVKQDAKIWQPFINEVLIALYQTNPKLKLLLFGKIAQIIDKMHDLEGVDGLSVEHPYNISFISNEDVIKFFLPMRLLNKH